MKRIFTRVIVVVLLLQFTFEVTAQTTVSGVIKAEDGSTLPGVTVQIKGTDLGTITDIEGNYKIDVPSDGTLIFSFIGMETIEKPVKGLSSINVTMVDGSQQLMELVVVGSRSTGRTKLETPAPVDIIDIKGQQMNMPQTDLAQMLVATAPSFAAFRSQGGDLSSHVDPPTLRGLAPNQMLVLINGKRRHTSALLAGTQTGSSANSVDMSFISPDMIDRVEILRDGAAAQYGSDAIAGVMNIILKEGTGKFSGSYTTGFNPNIAPNFTAEEKATLDDTQQALLADTEPDGFTHRLAGNYGLGFGNGGYFNISGMYKQTERTIRPNVLGESTTMYGTEYLTNQKTDTYGNPIITNPELVEAIATGAPAAEIAALQTDDGLLAARGLTRQDLSAWGGQPRTAQGVIGFNLGVPLSPNAEFYSFGDFGYKYLEGYSCYFRRPSQADRANFELYPNGFRPQMTSNQSNVALTAGVDGTMGDYRFDFSNTIGANSMQIGMFNTFNSSLQTESPTEMRLGTHAFTQNTTNFDVSRFFPDVLKGLNIAVGAEMRYENYKIVAGQAESYTAGDAGLYTASTDNELLIGPDGMPLEGLNSTPLVDGSGDPLSLDYAGVSRTFVKGYSPNCQCFRGFAPKNEADQSRYVTGAYLDMELDVTKSFLLSAAVRGESYSDFGGVITGKGAFRYSITDNFAFRGSASTGFRAPSLQELNYSHTYTFFIGLDPYDGTLYPNSSNVASAIGIGQLQEERASNVSVGFGAKFFKKLNVTVDAYMIKITDRLFSTDEFNASEAPVLAPIIGEGLASFRINGGDISSKGIEFVANYGTGVGAGSLDFTFSGIFRQNQFDKASVPALNTLLTTEQLEAKYIDRASIGQFEEGTPSTTMIASAIYSLGKFSTMLRGYYYGSVIDRASASAVLEDGSYPDQEFSPQTTVDLGISYQFSEMLGLTIGGNNIFNAIPDILIPRQRGIYLYSNYQQGSAGSYYFARLNFKF
ncbi:MAG: TonB-dependent receptor [Cyclobacteriaceae bacterium]|nr:TonB-dependent receptor [Cyclobacteriaceae bacterium SS2]